MNNKIEQLSSLFGSKTRYKIIKLYVENGNSKFFVREITRLINEQINSVRRELENLEGIGLLTSKDKNNKRYFFVDTKSSIYPGLCALMGSPNTHVPLNENNKSVIDNVYTSSLDKVCSDLVVKPLGDDLMPVDIFCVVNSSADKIKALNILQKIENKLKNNIGYSVLTKDEYSLGIKSNPELYDTIHKIGIKRV
jgi:hypothetical protein